MKHKFTILVALIIISAINALSQEQTYKLSKLKLKTGEIIKIRNIKVYDSKVIYSRYNSTINDVMQVENTIEEIEDLTIPTKTAIIPGALVGTAGGIVTMLIVKKEIEKPEVWVGPGWSATVEKTMSNKLKILIIMGGAAIGSTVGLSIKTGWKSILPIDAKLLKNFDIDLTCNPSLKYMPMLNISYKF